MIVEGSPQEDRAYPEKIKEKEIPFHKVGEDKAGKLHVVLFPPQLVVPPGNIHSMNLFLEYGVVGSPAVVGHWRVGDCNLIPLLKEVVWQHLEGFVMLFYKGLLLPLVYLLGQIIITAEDSWGREDGVIPGRQCVGVPDKATEVLPDLGELVHNIWDKGTDSPVQHKDNHIPACTAEVIDRLYSLFGPFV